MTVISPILSLPLIFSPQDIPAGQLSLFFKKLLLPLLAYQKCFVGSMMLSQIQY